MANSSAPKFSPLKALRDYFSGAIQEFHKVTWPTKEQAAMLTGVVVIFSLIMALLIAAFDLGLTELYQLLLEQFTA